MRVLILANDAEGLYIFRAMLIEKLIAQGNTVYASTPFDYRVKDLEKIGCHIIKTNIDRRGLSPFEGIRLIKEYLKIIRAVNPDKVITYTIKPNIYGGIACRISKKSLYANITGLGTAFQNNGLLTKLVTTMYKVAFKKAKMVFFENTENRFIIIQKGIIDEKRTHCLNGAGVNIDEYTYSNYPMDGEVKFLFIGRVMHEKGVDELFSAVARLKEAGYSLTLDVVGQFEESYAEKISEIEKTKLIKYYGHQIDVKPFIEKAHCFVLPSYHEGMANTLLECGAMGRPLITSNIHGCLEAVQDGETGYLCNVKDADDLYEKMKRFIELPYDRKKEMGRKSHEYVSSKFDKKKVVEETVGVIMG